jgi:hypothetical protein
MAIDVQALATTMFEAAWKVLKEKAPEVEGYAEGEFKKIAQTIATIEAARVRGQIAPEQAALLLDMQKSATRSVLLCSSGMELLAAEAAVNAALAAARPVINGAIGFVLV